MIVDPSAPLQKAQFAALTTDARMVAFFAPATPRVYDRPPPKADRVYPYVTIGADDQVLDDSAEGLDGVEVYTRTHVWSDAVGVVEAKRLTAIVNAVLDAPLAVEGHVVVVHDFESIQPGASADPLISHRVVEHRYLTEPSA